MLYEHSSGGKWLAVLLAVLLLASAVVLTPVRSVEAATTTIDVYLYYTNMDVAEHIALTLTNITSLTPQGDGETHYYHQGPTFNEEDPWDSGETVNLKDKGALVGADVKDICELLTSTVPSDSEIEIKAYDGFSKTFDYDDVYNPQSAQGKLVICYECNGTSVPSWSDGLRLVFFADDCVFGNWDMHETLDEDEWHYYDDGDTEWPSTNGLSVKYVNRINIYDK